MKILVVCSGNSEFGISPFIKDQSDSLRKKGIKIDYFLIKGKGLFGYLKNIAPLRKYIKKNKFDIIHSHYSLTSFITTFAGAKDQITSLMGSDVNSGFFQRSLIKIFNKFFWKVCIVKSEDMKKKIGINNALIIPNGVNIDKFKPINKKKACEKVKFDPDKRYILFAADPLRTEKNFQLADKAYKLLSDNNVNLQVVSGVTQDLVPYYLNAADVLILTSNYEGSPNIIKEAMACNCPIVSTDVGDVKWVIGETEGCFITSFSPEDVSKKIKSALEFSGKNGRTNGRKRLIDLQLNSESVAIKLVNIYKNLLNRNNIR